MDATAASTAEGVDSSKEAPCIAGPAPRGGAGGSGRLDAAEDTEWPAVRGDPALPGEPIAVAEGKAVRLPEECSVVVNRQDEHTTGIRVARGQIRRGVGTHQCEVPSG